MVPAVARSMQLEAERLIAAGGVLPAGRLTMALSTFAQRYVEMATWVSRVPSFSSPCSSLLAMFLPYRPPSSKTQGALGARTSTN